MTRRRPMSCTCALTRAHGAPVAGRARPGGRSQRVGDDVHHEGRRCRAALRSDADDARPRAPARPPLWVPPAAAAVRLTGVTVRFCAAVLSQDGVIEWASPSLACWDSWTYRASSRASPSARAPLRVVRGPRTTPPRSGPRARQRMDRRREQRHVDPGARRKGPAAGGDRRALPKAHQPDQYYALIGR